MTQSLRDELRALAGVASAEVEAEGDVPSGIKVRLLPDADADRVGAEVQRVLAAHGMRSRIASDGGASSPGVPARSVSGPTITAGTAPIEPPPSARVSPGPEALDSPPAPAPAVGRSSVPSVSVPAGGELASLAFEESSDGATVTAISTDGKRFTRRAAAITDEAVAAAVVAAVGALAEGRPQRLVWVTTETVQGTTVVTVLVEKADGSRCAGAAVVRGAIAYAVARATWMALRG
jgi:hypothetical protein